MDTATAESASWKSKLGSLRKRQLDLVSKAKTQVRGKASLLAGIAAGLGLALGITARITRRRRALRWIPTFVIVEESC